MAEFFRGDFPFGPVVAQPSNDVIEMGHGRHHRLVNNCTSASDRLRQQKQKKMNRALAI